MTYDPQTYWTAAGRDRENAEHESHFVRTPVFAHQEERLMALLRNLDFRSVLEVGCGWGRVTKLVSDEWPDVPYTAFDLSDERIDSAGQKAPEVTYVRSTIQDFDPTSRWLYPRGPKWDLVLAVETLMHVKPSEIEEVVAKLLALSSKYVVSLDWAVPLNVPIAPHNFLHDYPKLYGERLVSVEQLDLQALYLAEVGSGLAGDGGDAVTHRRKVDDGASAKRKLDREGDGGHATAGVAEQDVADRERRRVGVEDEAPFEIGDLRSQRSLLHREVER